MLYLKICLTALLSVLILFLLTKLIGYRQVSEMSMFDYVNSITIGSIAAELSVSKGEEILVPVLAMVIFGVSTFLLSIITNKSLKIRNLVEGSPIIIMEGGKLYFNSLRRAHIDLNEFLENCRISGYFDISKLDTVILESNGKMSFIPKAKDRPLTPADVENAENVKVPSQEKISPPVIIDGEIIKKSLSQMGYNESWLFKSLAERNIKEIDNIFLATASCDGTLNVYIKTKDKAPEKL